MRFIASVANQGGKDFENAIMMSCLSNWQEGFKDREGVVKWFTDNEIHVDTGRVVVSALVGVHQTLSTWQLYRIMEIQ